MDLFRNNGISFLIKVPFDTKHLKISNFLFATQEHTFLKCQFLEAGLGTMRKLWKSIFEALRWMQKRNNISYDNVKVFKNPYQCALDSACWDCL